MAKIVQNNNNVINELRDKIIETAKKSPYYEIINSFYGIGEILTAEILGELGDITRFDSPKQLIAFCGLDSTKGYGNFPYTNLYVSTNSVLARHRFYSYIQKNKKED